MKAQQIRPFIEGFLAAHRLDEMRKEAANKPQPWHALPDWMFGGAPGPGKPVLPDEPKSE